MLSYLIVALSEFYISNLGPGGVANIHLMSYSARSFRRNNSL